MINSTVTIDTDYLLMAGMGVGILVCLWCLKNIIFSVCFIGFSGLVGWIVYTTDHDWKTSAFVGMFILLGCTLIMAVWKPCKRSLFGRRSEGMLAL